MIDFHCHLDLYKDPLTLLGEVEKRCKFILAVTTSPRAWIKTSQVFSRIECIKVGLGMHPEILADRINERELFLSSISKCAFIGEIGLDGTLRNKNSLYMQMEFFTDTIKKCEECNGKVMSIHSRSAVKNTLQIIEQNSCNSKPVLHWFTGTINEMEWAISLDCWFSINPLMFSTNKGINLIEKMPLSKILPETDGPFATHNGLPYMPWDTELVIDGLSNIHRMPRREVVKLIVNNLNMICTNKKIV
ncbi:MAG: Qat anti-phage system TatD family nuclease QatD [Lachnospiraceae bacterium]